MSNRLSFFISVFVVALVISVSFVQLFTENTSRRTRTSLGAQVADFASGISIYTIVPSDDAFLREGAPENSSFLRTGDEFGVAYLKFDISEISAPVSSATLYLTQESGDANEIVTVSLGEHSNWTEHTLSSNSAPAAVSEIGSFTSIAGDSITYAVDIAGIAGNGTYTIVLTMAEGEARFSSSEKVVLVTRPRLEIVTGGSNVLSSEITNILPQ
ncbi:MAG: DNRLRE domain-containing protein [Candidatus Paceibacterota bacterium]